MGRPFREDLAGLPLESNSATCHVSARWPQGLCVYCEFTHGGHRAFVCIMSLHIVASELFVRVYCEFTHGYTVLSLCFFFTSGWVSGTGDPRMHEPMNTDTPHVLFNVLSHSYFFFFEGPTVCTVHSATHTHTQQSHVLLSFCLFFETGFLCVALAVLELTL